MCDIEKCKVCQDDHYRLETTKLENVIKYDDKTYDRFVICPKTNQRIYLVEN